MVPDAAGIRIDSLVIPQSNWRVLTLLGLAGVAAFIFMVVFALPYGVGHGVVTTTGLAYVSIRRRLIEQHKEWMIRSYVVTPAFVNFRIVVGILQGAGVGTLTEQLTAASWFCGAVPLLLE